MFRKVFKIGILSVSIGLVIFVILVFAFGRPNDRLKAIRISFFGKPVRVLDSGFSKPVEIQDIDLNKLAEIDWAKTFDKALKDKRQVQKLNNTKSNETVPISSQEASLAVTASKSSSNISSQSFLQYLIKSNLPLDSTKNPFQEAIALRDAGEPQQINQLIQQMDDNIAKLEKVIPPEEAIGYHIVRLRLLREIKAALKEIQVSPKGQPLEEVVSKEELQYLEKLSLILKKYLTYFFYPSLRDKSQ